jgi:tetratricopeptide (TPR) repeat protein
VGDDLVGAIKRMPRILADYLCQARGALLQAPSVVNEPNVQDWLVRLDALAREGRWADLSAFERWMMLAFGREPYGSASSETLAIDVRLHRRLGQLYLDQKQFAEAAAQLRLAWRLAPRDIFVLRPLATASLKLLLSQGTGRASLLEADLADQLAAIRELDHRFELAPDTAALVANYLRHIQQKPDAAAQILQACLAANPDSYYAADLLAQTRLQQGRLDQARLDYQAALDITRRVHDQSLWRRATAATACLALNQLEEAREHLVALVAWQPAPTPQELDSVESSLVDVATATGVSRSQLQELLAALQRPPPA